MKVFRQPEMVLAIFSFLLLIVMLLDSFLLSPFLIQEKFKSGEIKKTRGRRYSYSSYLITSHLNHTFNVPQRPYDAIGFDSTFYIGRSRIFRRSLKIFWEEEEGQWYSVKIGILNSVSYISYAVFAFSAYAFINFLIRRNNPTKTSKRYLYTGATFLLVLFLMYLFQ